MTGFLPDDGVRFLDLSHGIHASENLKRSIDLRGKDEAGTIAQNYVFREIIPDVLRGTH